MKSFAVCLIGLLASVSVASAEVPTVSGQVRLASGEPAVGAQVMLFDLADLRRYVGATTDESGYFVLPLKALGASGLPVGFGLGQNYPNPFNPGTVIPYKLASEGYVRLEVFNLLGQRVATLVDGVQAAGAHTVVWDARDGSGHGVAAGVYIYRLTAGGGMATRRMVLVDGSAGASGASGAVVVEEQVDAPVYGLTVSGAGLAMYVDAAFVVGDGSVELVVEASTGSASMAAAGRGKAAQGGVLGDVNADGWVNIVDALIVATYSVNPGIAVPNGGDIALGDVNADGQVNIVDALLIATYSVDPGNAGLPAGIGQPVAGTANQPPIAEAGPDQSVDRRETIGLDGSNSSDPEGQRLSFVWRQVAGEPIALANAGGARPTFATEVVGNYAFELVVHDGAMASAPDTVGVEVVAIAEAAVKVGSPDAALAYQATDGDQMTFSVRGTAEPVEVGDVLVNTVEPYFLKKVVSVQRQNASEVVVMTEDAALTEVIEEGQIRRTFQLPAAKIVAADTEFTLHDDAAARLRVTHFDISFPTEFVFEVEIKKSGFLWRKSTLESVETGIRGDFVATLELALEAHSSFELNADKTVSRVPKYIVFAVGWVPVMLEVMTEIGVGADFSAAVAGQVTSGITMRKPLALGAQYARGSGWRKLTGGGDAAHDVHDPTLEIQGSAAVLEIQGSAGVRGYVRGQLEFNLYAVAGPYFGMKPYLGLGAVANLSREQIDWSLHTGLDGYVGVKAAIFDRFSDENPADAFGDFNLFETSLKEGVIALERPVDPGIEEPGTPDDPVVGGGSAREERAFSLPGGGGMAFVWIEPGVFQMGSPESEPGRFSREGPLHEVEISRGFWLGKYEVTQWQWESVMGATPWSGESYVQEHPAHPAVYISWHDVQEFIEKLNSASVFSVYRLPTEAEWEYVCRAGTQTRWSFGDAESQLTHYAWYADNAWDVGEGYAHAGGLKRPNPWGLYNMHGNVWEWVQDRYDSDSDYYNSSPRVDPPGPDTGSNRVLRGGSFYNYAQFVRSAARYDASPDSRDGDIGVRLVRIRLH